MRLKTTFRIHLKLLTIILLGATLIACGSSSNSRLNPDPGTPGNGGGNGGGNGNGNGGGNGTPTSYSMGNGFGDDFTQGQIAVGIGSDALAPGGRTTLSVTVVDNNSNLRPEELSVDFTSPCIVSGSALVEPASSTNGSVTVEYIANGCVGADNIIATSAVEGSVLSAAASVTVEADTVQTIQFVEATPNFISLHQTGGEEVSEVRFRVVGATGAAMANVGVEFTLNQGSGDATLVRDTGTSGPNGYVTTLVQSGYRAGTVRVTAHIPAEGISTQSSQLVVSTGIPVQGRTSISASDLLPVSWNTDGIESSITLRMGDQFANPVADGTAVYFTTTGGVIESGCVTSDGACSVLWKSQDPRPLGTNDYTIDPITGVVTCPGGGECRNGRVLVLATAVGNETFVDMNQSGRYEHTVDIFNTGSSCGWNTPLSSLSVANPLTSAVACDDLGEAYLDVNRNGVRDAAEPVIDENGAIDPAGLYTAGNEIYDGILCSDTSLAAGQCTRNTVTVRDHLTLVMTSNRPLLPVPGMPAEINIGLNQAFNYRMVIADENGNGMPAGTSISVDSSVSQNVNFTVTPGTIGGVSEPSVIILRAESDENDPADGDVFLEISSGGLTTRIAIPINP